MRRLIIATLLGLGLGLWTGTADAGPTQVAGSVPALAMNPGLMVPVQYRRPYYGPPPRHYGRPRYAPPPRYYGRPRYVQPRPRYVPPPRRYYR